MRPVIISSGGPALEPYWPPLAADFDLVLVLDEVAQSLNRQGLPAEALSGYMPPATPEALFQLMLDILFEVDWTAAQDKFHWPGWTAQPECWLKGFVARQVAEMLPRVLALDNLRARRQIAGVLVHEDITPHLNYLVQWARAAEIPSVHVCHGAYWGYGEGQVTDPHAFLEADFACVWNERQRDYLVANGARPEQVRLTGPGIEDKWVTMVPDRDHSKALFGFDSRRPVVLYVGTWMNRLRPEDEEREVEIESDFLEFLEATKELPDWQVLVSAHPGQHKWNQGWFAERMRKHDVKGVALMNQIPLCAQAADVLYSGSFSLAMTEAALIGRPTVLSGAHSDQEGFFVLAEHDPRDIASKIRTARGIEETRQWQRARNRHCYDTMYLCDGKAIERTMAVFKEAFKLAQE